MVGAVYLPKDETRGAVSAGALNAAAGAAGLAATTEFLPARPG